MSVTDTPASSPQPERPQPEDSVNRSTEDVEQDFYAFLTSDGLTLLKTGIRYARKSELIFQELADRGEI